MSSKTSLFDKAIFKSDLKRNWWVMALEMLILVLSCILPTLEDAQYNQFPNLWYSSMVSIFIFSMVSANLLFKYLHSAGPVTTLHSYPVTRSQLFTTKTITGLLFCLTPLLITAIILCALSLVLTSPGYIKSFGISDVASWFFASYSFAVVFFSLTLIVNMITGNSIAATIFTIGFSILPLIFIESSEMLLRSELFGYIHENNNILNYIYLDPDDISQNVMWWIYPLYSALLMAGAYSLYRIRKLENHGEIIAVSWLKPLYMTIITYLSAVFGYSYIVTILRTGNIYSSIIFAAAGALIAHMVAKKSLDFKGGIKTALIAAACCLVFALGIDLDITGYEKRVPAPQDVESVVIDTPYHNEIYYAALNNLTFSDEDSIAYITNLHKTIINEYNTRNGVKYFGICYNLKNGRTIERVYHLPEEVPFHYMEKIYETKEFKQSSSALFNTAKRSDEELTLYDSRLSADMSITPLSPFYEQLVEAMKEDIMNYPTEYFASYWEASSHITVSWNEPATNSDGKHYTEARFNLDKYAVNTKKVLETMPGVYDLPTAEDIERIHVNYVFVGNNDGNKIITDNETIAEIYALYDDMQNNFYDRYYEDGTREYYNISLTYVLKNEITFDVDRQYPENKLPEVFKKIISNK